MITYLFPGQGSQVRGMGENLFDEFPKQTAIADKILGYSVKNLCLQNPDNQLFQTQYTQPALYVVNALSYIKKMATTDKKPDYVIGHSLGELNALHVAGAFDFETGLTIVKKRGELMSTATGGGMAAIIGLSADRIHEILRLNQFNNLTIANYNSYAQFVVSGPKQDVEAARPHFEKNNGVIFIPLKVSGAFHSPYMNEIQASFDAFLQQFKFNITTIPVIANVDAKPYHPSVTKVNLSKHINHPVLWVNSIEYLMKYEVLFEEIGPGNVLNGLINRIKGGR